MGAHALLAPSSAKRWMTCAPSARLEANLPDKDTSYSREGTIAHAMAENILKFYVTEDFDQFEDFYSFITSCDFIIKDQIIDAEAEGIDWKEMAETVYENYCRIVYEAYLGARLQDPEATLLIEARLRLGEFIPEGFGSSDAVLIYGDTLEVFDLKYGKGVKVEAENNPQMMCYALGAYCGPGELYDINNVRMTIVQPRLRHCSSWVMETHDLLTWATEQLHPAAIKAYNGEGDQTPGDHCRFCKAQAICPKLAEHTLRITSEQTQPGLMTLEEVAKLLPHFETIKKWIAAVEDYALEQALNGEAVPGYKIVEGRSVRKIANASEAATRLEKAGFDATQYLKKPELKTITELEKMLTKKSFNTILGDLVIKPEGKPTLAEESDPREAYSRAKSDFNELL